MNSLFSVNVKYLKLKEGTDGYKKMNETYLVNAVSFTDAEAKTVKEMEIRGIAEFQVESIKREKYSYVLQNQEDGGMFYNAMIEYSVEQEDSEKPKKIRMSLCVESSHIDNVNEIVKEVVANDFNYGLIKVSLSKIFYVIK
ncbi:MAG: DUF4494 family protein [Terrimicrobiaceae bacterium]